MDSTDSAYATRTAAVATGQTDNGTGLDLTTGTGADLRFSKKTLIQSDQAITIKFNATTNDAITIKAGQDYWFYDFIVFRIFVTNSSGSTANVAVYGQGPAVIA